MNFKQILQTVVEQDGWHQNRIGADPTRRVQSLQQMRQAINAELLPALNELPALTAAANRSGSQAEIARASRLGGDLKDLSNALSGICDDGRGSTQFASLVSAHARSLERQVQREEAGPDSRPPLPQQT
jgi:hypothetical protein